MNKNISMHYYSKCIWLKNENEINFLDDFMYIFMDILLEYQHVPALYGIPGLKCCAFLGKVWNMTIMSFSRHCTLHLDILSNDKCCLHNVWKKITISLLFKRCASFKSTNVILKHNEWVPFKNYYSKCIKKKESCTKQNFHVK